jgi:hypothetical protein
MTVTKANFNPSPFVERLYDPVISYLSDVSVYDEIEGHGFTYQGLPKKPLKDSSWPESAYIRLTALFKDQVYNTNGTVVGPYHVLTGGSFVYNEKAWADEITVSSLITNTKYSASKVYVFEKWVQNNDPQYNMALIVMGKSLAKYTGWLGLLTTSDDSLQGGTIRILGVPHTLQKIEPESFICEPKPARSQNGNTLTARHWKMSFVVGLETQDRNFHPLTARLSKPKVEALAQAISFKRYPSIAFGKEQWAKYFGDVGDEPPLPPKILKILNSSCPIWPGQKVHETHLLTLIPKTVNGQPLTLKTLGELVQKPLQGPPSKFQYLDLGQSQDIPPEHSYWTLLSRDVIPGSRNKSYANQQKLVQQYPGYEVPHVLDTAVALFMEHVQSGTRLYSDAPWTFTRCQEKYSDQWQLIVGGFAVGGLRVSHTRYRAREVYVVGVARKFH